MGGLVGSALLSLHVISPATDASDISLTSSCQMHHEQVIVSQVPDQLCIISGMTLSRKIQNST
jgi:hypothetical protein